MDAVLRALVVYFVLMLIFRISGQRTLAQMTSFDLILLLIISETIQQALVDSDQSITHAFLLVLTLVGTAIALSLLKQKSPFLEKLLEGTPVVIIKKGQMQRERMERLRVDEADIMQAARQQEGLRRLDEIEWAVVESSGDITVIPKENASNEK
jgi:uncharacterized membrane protein YcaP (DUF421 family)